MTVNKIKLANLAKDLNLKNKELIDILATGGYVKTTSATLEPDEFSYLMDQLTKQYQITGFDDYLDKKTVIADDRIVKPVVQTAKPQPAPEKGPKTAAPATASGSTSGVKKEGKDEKRENKAVESAPKADAQPSKKTTPVVSEKGNERNNQPKPQPKPHTPSKKREEVKQDRFAAANPLAPQNPQKQQKKEKQGQEKQQRPVSPFPSKRPINTTSTTVTTSETAEYTGNKTKVIDTRGSSVDLSKYDEKLERIANDHNGSQYENNNQRQKLKKQNQKGNTRSDRERQGMQKMKQQASQKPVKQQLSITVPDEITVGELASRLKVTAGEVIKRLLLLGTMANVNQTIDYDTAEYIAVELGAKVTKEVVVTIEEKLFDDSEDSEEQLEERAPVVCVMGHVDHGKTSILDKIRHANVTAGEAGGITQAIGAYRVHINGKDITFLDTPGHEAFTAMRARGAMATDIAILVVAADDGIMPQTVEAINHAKAAGVDIIVAINKMDKPGANPEAIKQELTKYELVPEEWGGDVICVPVSALTGMGIEDLLENILLVAEVKNLRSNPNRRAKGIVIEARLDKGRGPVATLLVQNGTLKAGDVVIAGTAVGRVRAMTDDKGKNIKSAGPSVPVEIIGLAEVPEAGDEFAAVQDEKMARELAEQRKNKLKQDEFKASSNVSLDDLFSQISGGVKNLNIVLKADVGGSVEAVKSSLLKLSNDEVKVNVIHSAVGGINEGDVMLATASNALVIGFNVRPDKNALDMAARQKIDIRTYRIIYECIEEISAAMKGMLAPTFKENLLGHAEVRQTIHVSSVGTIAGSYVQDGKITRNAQIRVVRDGVVVFEDKISSLRRFKDDVKEVATGYECGIGLERFNDI
ncbi:MAG: translation initiation factor IF-2, partial [Eubacteriales bacterium]